MLNFGHFSNFCISKISFRPPASKGLCSKSDIWKRGLKLKYAIQPFMLIKEIIFAEKNHIHCKIAVQINSYHINNVVVWFNMGPFFQGWCSCIYKIKNRSQFFFSSHSTHSGEKKVFYKHYGFKTFMNYQNIDTFTILLDFWQMKTINISWNERGNGKYHVAIS